jgi:hypothetical protein
MRKGTTMLRRILCCTMLCCLTLAVAPLSLLAANSSGAAMLYTKGTAWLNGGTIPGSSAIFPGDLVQTKPDSMANINASGSNVMVLPDSLVTFEGPAVAVDHGGISVTTAKSLQTHASDVTVTPASNSWTEFDVSHQDGKVLIMARKGDLNINDGSETTTLAQGQQTVRYDSPTKKKRQNGGATPAAGGGILDSPWVWGSALVGLAGFEAWVITRSSNPTSPSHP